MLGIVIHVLQKETFILKESELRPWESAAIMQNCDLNISVFFNDVFTTQLGKISIQISSGPFF